jgi:hypothetical protein
MKKRSYLLPAIVFGAALGASPVYASSVIINNGSPDGLMASASRIGGGGVVGIESADDFILSSPTSVTGGTFIGLMPATGATIENVTVEIYRVFPNDSNTVRTPNVPTRANSPSDVLFDSRSFLAGGITSLTTSILAASFTAANSVINGINPKPNQTTGGEGAVTGHEVQFSMKFTTPFNLPTDHYFFVPQVQLTDGTFLWLSAGTPVTPDLQGWVRNDNLDPDWLRIGTDIVGGATPPKFNFAFSLEGDPATTPLPAALPLFVTGLGALGLLGWRRKRKALAA